MGLEIIARTGSYADFLKAYRKRARVFRRRAVRKLYGGSSLVMWALGNNSMEDRYAMVDFLLEQGAVPGPPDPYGDGPLHVLFSRVDWDSASDARIAERLIEMGADINLRNDKGMVPLKELLLRKGTRAQMAPLYRPFLLAPDLDVTTPDRGGHDLVEAARLLRGGFALEWLT
ncbi:ankyrin repeat protein, partial [Actinomyces sp. oral taxon 877 str. F0543]